jgi:hypothetical protein
MKCILRQPVRNMYERPVWIPRLELLVIRACGQYVSSLLIEIVLISFC